MDQSGASASRLMENYMQQVAKTVQLRCGRIVPVPSDYGEQKPRRLVMDMVLAQRTYCTIRI